MAEELKYQSEHTGQQMDQAIDNYVAMTQAVQTAENSATAASASATAAAKSAADAQAVTQGQKGYFETDTALKAAHPTGQVGWWAIVGSTDTIWVWDDTTSTWLNSGNQTDLSNYYTKTQADAEFPAGTIVLESEDPTLVPLNADTLGGQASSYYGRAADVGDAATLTTTAKTVVSAINENKARIDTLNQNLVPAAGSITVGASWTTSLASYTIQNNRCYMSLLVIAKYDISASAAQFTSRASQGLAYLLFNKSSGGFVSALIDTSGNISFTSNIAAGETLWCKDSYSIQ